MLCVVDWTWGVTQLDNIVYVVFLFSSVIEMYTADTLSPLAEGIHVEGMKSPNDIVACRDDRQLYVADDNSCIWRVSADDHTYVKWLPTESAIDTVRTESTTDTFHTLSVTSRRLLLVTSQVPGLHQYSTTDGQLIRVISLPGYVVVLRHGVETTRNTFVVCHRGTSEDKEQCAVSDPYRF